MQSAGTKTGDEENAISSYNFISGRQNLVPSPCGYQSKYVTSLNEQVTKISPNAFSSYINLLASPTPTPSSSPSPYEMKSENVLPPNEGRWMKHYSSCHRILLVGEGDFSFSTCLATAFGFASNMVATSLDSREFLVNNYGGAASNLMELSMRNCKVIHGINATQMANHAYLCGMKFDRIIFNFPFAGFFKELSRATQIILHTSLVSGFMENAKKMLSENGEIHITHKTNGFHNEWKLEVVASMHRLRLVEAVDFNNLDYRGYNTKRGFGGDGNFYCNPSKTYKFRLI